MQESVISALLALLFAFAGINVIHQPAPQEKTAKVTEVVDGDTVEIMRNGEKDTVRVLGIDTPEVHVENTPREFYLENTTENMNCLEKIGENASRLVKRKLAGEKVRIVRDPLSDRRGSYERLLAYIEYNSTGLGKMLLEKGYARVYNSSFRRKSEYRAIEVESRRNNEGIWNESCSS
ncbi:MAG: thermonuclease family protein [Candidatus Nanohalobium sp.]